MFFYFKYHFIKVLLLLFFILISCQLQEPAKNHGILFLENRSDQLTVKKTNKNDVLKTIGQPHSRSIDNEHIWIYVERTLSKGKYHKLGQHTLKTNNVLVLTFDKYGILKEKKFYDKQDIAKINFSKNKTENRLAKKSFVETFLQSVRQKMYSGRK
jgi:outer membrane protein assembly factor BamE (lipoprotein component of BamABCDE complex)